MAEEKVEPRETNWRQLLPWTELFRGFQVALDLNKLALAAGGILVMAFGWWFLAALFTVPEKAEPQWATYKAQYPNDEGTAWTKFRQDRDHWNLMRASAGLGSRTAHVKPLDVIDNADEADKYVAARTDYEHHADAEKALADARAALDAAKTHAVNPDTDENVKAAQRKVADAEALARLATVEDNLKAHGVPETRAAALAALEQDRGPVKPYGRLSTWPWWEERGPNPFLLATGQQGKPWEVGHFWEWFMTQQLPVLLEPVGKLLAPVVYFFSPGADWWAKLYFLCVLIWMVLTWAVFGGAITRIASVQVARGEKIGMAEALNFVRKRIVAYVTAPLFPLLFILVLLIGMIVFGLFVLIPIFGDIVVAGVFWPVMIAVGLLMAIALVGLVGWPLMSATISAEGTDSWEAVSRAYSYVYQRPWHFIWYGVVALVYGAAVVFFIGFMGSLTIYLAKWGVSETPGITYRGTGGPSFLFAYAPTSFGWRDLLLQGATVDKEQIVGSDGQVDETAYNKWLGSDDAYNKKMAADPQHDDRLAWWNKVGAFLVAIWLGIAFLLILGFGYSYFWSASTIMYMLLRRNVDAAEMDEVYLEEDEGEGAFGAPLTSPAAPPSTAVKPAATGLTMVDAPSLRPPTPPAVPPPSVAPPEAVAPTPPGSPTDGGPGPHTEVGTAPTEPGP